MMDDFVKAHKKFLLESGASLTSESLINDAARWLRNSQYKKFAAHFLLLTVAMATEQQRVNPDWHPGSPVTQNQHVLNLARAACDLWQTPGAERVLIAQCTSGVVILSEEKGKLYLETDELPKTPLLWALPKLNILADTAPSLANARAYDHLIRASLGLFDLAAGIHRQNPTLFAETETSAAVAGKFQTSWEQAKTLRLANYAAKQKEVLNSRPLLQRWLGKAKREMLKRQVDRTAPPEEFTMQVFSKWSALCIPVTRPGNGPYNGGPAPTAA